MKFKSVITRYISTVVFSALLLITPILTEACENEPRGFATATMNDDLTICITVNIESLKPASKCFKPEEPEYSEIIKKFPNLKSGETKTIPDNKC